MQIHKGEKAKFVLGAKNVTAVGQTDWSYFASKEKSFLADMLDIAEVMDQWTMGQNQVSFETSNHAIIHIPVSLGLSE